MSSEPLTRSEVFGELRRELYGDATSSGAGAHLFIILGASVSTKPWREFIHSLILLAGSDDLQIMLLTIGDNVECLFFT